MFFIDHNIDMAASMKPEYKNEIIEHTLASKNMTYYIQMQEGFIGYRVTDNAPLTNLYGFPVKVVKFYSDHIELLHTEEQLSTFELLYRRLEQDMLHTPAYYNVRVPANMTDSVAALQVIKTKSFFCGGTVSFMAEGECAETALPQNLEIILADKNYLVTKGTGIVSISEESFRDYRSQYHISPDTCEHAGEIYTNWMKQAVRPEAGSIIMCAEWEGNLAGFSLLTESEYGVDMELTAVSEEFRNRGIYTLLMLKNLTYAQNRNKIFVSSTQLDNYGSQKTWASIGMKPYFTIYNFHYNTILQ